MLFYAIGELLAIAAAAAIGSFLFVDLPGKPLSHFQTMVLLGIAGCAEGLIIGWIQWKSLSKVLLHFRPVKWIATTTLSAVAGWLLILPPAIMLLAVLAKFSLINNSYSLFYTALLGVAFGALMGAPQFFYLKKFYNNAFVWIFANVLGWMCSFLIIYLSISMLANSDFFIFRVSVILLACVLSGLIQGLITGTCLHFAMSVKQEHLRNVSSSMSPLTTGAVH